MSKGVLSGLMLLVLAMAGGWWLAGSGPAPVPENAVSRHWQRPLPPQGAAPAHWPSEEADLDAAACGRCHLSQHQDWSESRHSRTMQAGILWQFDLFDQAASNACLDCHAPLAEQKALLALERDWPQRPEAAVPAFVPATLHWQGLTCAACHLRGQQRFGPPHRGGLRGDEEALPHGGFVPVAWFEDSAFCAGCHQFPEDGPRLNGKLRQNTYAEWQATSFAAAGRTCQDCHMPERRHLWRGISDPAMLRGALAVTLDARPLVADNWELRLRLSNVGAGHHVPTYLVPRIDVRLSRAPGEDAAADDGPEDSLLHHVIQWRADVDLQQELFDNRLAAGEHRDLTAVVVAPAAGERLELVIEVAPKEHYERLYQAMLRQADRMRPETLRLLRQAMREAAAARYQAVRASLPLARVLAEAVRLVCSETDPAGGATQAAAERCTWQALPAGLPQTTVGGASG